MVPDERIKPRKRSRKFAGFFSLACVAAIASVCTRQSYQRSALFVLPGVVAFPPCSLHGVKQYRDKARVPKETCINEYTDRSRRSRLMAINLLMRVETSDKNESLTPPVRHDATPKQTQNTANAHTYTGPPPPRTAGLSKFHQRILSCSIERQRLVTGRYPLVVTVEENPTRKWLGLGRDKTSSTSQMLVNGTSADRSLASYDRFQWLDDAEREELHDRYTMVSLELLAEIRCKKPAYLNVLPSFGAGSTAAARRAADVSPSWDRWKRNSVLFEKLEETIWQESRGDRLWATGFSLTKQRGDVYSVDTESGHIESVNSRTEKSILWPNEVNSVPVQRYDKGTRIKEDELEDALIISDGFLVPGRDKGGLRIVRNPGSPESEWSACLTGNEEENEGWFYHRATWVDLTGDGRKSILSARARRPSILNKGRSRSSESDSTTSPTKTQLVWLERPEPFKIDEDTGTPLEKDGTVFDPFGALHTPWKVRILDEGPDVMFCVADLDTEDDTVEVLASQFFNRKLSLHSIKRGREPRVVFRRTIDNNCGAAFSAILANLDNSIASIDHTRTVVDSGSTVITLQPGDSFSHLLVTSHECSFSESDGGSSELSSSSPSTERSKINGNELSPGTGNSLVAPDERAVDGGSVFAYRVPSGKKGAWKIQPWVRTVVASGFRVKPQLSNAINPGAPGFCYTFYPRKEEAMMRGGVSNSWKRPLIAVAGDCAESAYLFRPVNRISEETGSTCDSSARYTLLCEIQVGATVGSIGIGYDDFCMADQESGYAKIYVPCYEKDKVFVFAMGNGEDSYETDSGW